MCGSIPVLLVGSIAAVTSAGRLHSQELTSDSPQPAKASLKSGERMKNRKFSISFATSGVTLVTTSVLNCSIGNRHAPLKRRPTLFRRMTTSSAQSAHLCFFVCFQFGYHGGQYSVTGIKVKRITGESPQRLIA